jgi:hypothetical protein
MSVYIFYDYCFFVSNKIIFRYGFIRQYHINSEDDFYTI